MALKRLWQEMSSHHRTFAQTFCIYQAASCSTAAPSCIFHEHLGFSWQRKPNWRWCFFFRVKTETKPEKRAAYNRIITPPDGGYGWVVVTSSFLLQAIGGGVAFSFGVFFVEFLATFAEGKGTTAWIGSINTGLLFGAGRSTTLRVIAAGEVCCFPLSSPNWAALNGRMPTGRNWEFGIFCEFNFRKGAVYLTLKDLCSRHGRPNCQEYWALKICW